MIFEKLFNLSPIKFWKAKFYEFEQCPTVQAGSWIVAHTNSFNNKYNAHCAYNTRYVNLLQGSDLNEWQKHFWGPQQHSEKRYDIVQKEVHNSCKATKERRESVITRRRYLVSSTTMIMRGDS